MKFKIRKVGVLNLVDLSNGYYLVNKVNKIDNYILAKKEDCEKIINEPTHCPIKLRKLLYAIDRLTNEVASENLSLYEGLTTSTQEEINTICQTLIEKRKKVRIRNYPQGTHRAKRVKKTQGLLIKTYVSATMFNKILREMTAKNISLSKFLQISVQEHLERNGYAKKDSYEK